VLVPPQATLTAKDIKYMSTTFVISGIPDEFEE